MGSLKFNESQNDVKGDNQINNFSVTSTMSNQDLNLPPQVKVNVPDDMEEVT